MRMPEVLLTAQSRSERGGPAAASLAVEPEQGIPRTHAAEVERRSTGRAGGSALTLHGLDDGAVHAVCDLVGELDGDVLEPGRSQPFQVLPP